MKSVRQHLGWKLFISYLVIIVVGVVSLIVAAEFHTPTALDRHLAQMETMMSGNMSGMMADLSENFRRAINEVLLVATTAAFVTAVLVSTFVTRRIVSPVQEMKRASQRIAGGRYDERVQVTSEDELGDLARTFNQMAHQLAQIEERRRQLIGDVAHELRTPLSSIRSVMEGMVDGVLPAEPASFLSVQSEVGRLQRLVQDLEELSRAEAGQVSLEMVPTDPAGFIQPAIARLQTQFEDKGVNLHTEIGSNLPRVNADAERMTQVMLNLLGNALQYTPASGQVTVRAWADTSQVYIEVQDTGIGLTAEQLRHVFERFYRVDKSRSRAGGGSGIGLTISKHLVEAHSGHLTATSHGLNKGSTFTVTLPVS